MSPLSFLWLCALTFAVTYDISRLMNYQRTLRMERYMRWRKIHWARNKRANALRLMEHNSPAQ